MKVVFLGTGTSVGVPMIGCACAVCTSADPRNRRRRSSVYVESGGTHVVVDTPPDFREQMLQYRIRRLDAVLFTHSHADHIFGLDDIRRFNTMQGSPIPVYAAAEALADIRRVFYYVERPDVSPGTYRPEIDFRAITAPFSLGSIHVVPLAVVHGQAATLGFRFECGGRTLGYVPDCHEMPEESERKLRGVDVMILDGLRHRPHPTHLTLEASVKLMQRIGARKSYLIHLCHEIEHEATQRILPASVFVSHDGLTLEW